MGPTGVPTEGVTNEAAVGLPSLSVRRKPTWDSYRIEFLDDGYPGRRTGEQVHAHPIYGPYVITDYLGQYRTSGQTHYLDAACRVADAAVARMTERHGSLVFEYQPNTGLSSLPNTFYSGLTQSRYLSALGRLEVALGDRRYAEASAAVMRSLHVPAELGGVARRTPGDGLLIEESSHPVPDYTLNGWTTATTLVHEYAQATGDEEARAVFEDSVRGIVDVLPLYDVPELANSRYRLTGSVRIKLLFSRPGASVLGASVDIPGQGTFPVGTEGGKWKNRHLSGVGDGGHLRHRQSTMEVLLCRVTWPRPNRLVLELEAVDACHLSVQVGQGPYHPLQAGLQAEDYGVIGEVALAVGRSRVDLPIPWVSTELAAYPTNFRKRIGGQHYNSYHFIHVDTLTALAALTDDDTITYYRDRWAQYPDRWPTMPVYADADIVLERYPGTARKRQRT